MANAYFTKVRRAVQNGVGRTFVGQELGLLGSGQGKFGFQSVWVSTSVDLKVLFRPRTDFASRSESDSLWVSGRRNLSVVGALSRTFSVPSVSGPAIHVCGYHIDLALSGPSEFVVGKSKSLPMALSGSRAFLGQSQLDALISKHGPRSFSTSAGVFYGDRSLFSCRGARMSMNKNADKPTKSLIFGYLIYSAGKRWYFSEHNAEHDFLAGTRDFHSSSPSCSPADTASDVSFDNSSRGDSPASSSASSDETGSALKTLKLLSGSCYLPHPDKEDTGGEDAHFICADEQAIGVADGVGGWADVGIDSGLYSRELMSNSATAIQDEPKGSIDPARVLEKAHSNTKAKGSSTACIIALTEQGLHAVNLGDSGFMVVRDGHTVFRSPAQLHGFNFTYQLEHGNSGDLPSSGQVFTVPVAPGDVIIAGTDGLFDNLYNNEITAVVVHAVRAGLEPQVTAQKIAALARQRAQDKDRQTPFSTAAQDAGFRYYGGKLDDITVVVSFVKKTSEENKSSSS